MKPFSAVSSSLEELELFLNSIILAIESNSKRLNQLEKDIKILQEKL